VAHTVRESELLKRTAVQLESISISALDATLPAGLPATDRRVDLASLPRLDMREGDDSAEYQLGRAIGTGGMGVVQTAVQRAMSRNVAVKRLRAELENVEAATSILLDEAVLTGSLEHPNVVPIYALGRDDREHPAMVMKHLSGVSWRELLLDPSHPLVTAREGEQLTYHLGILVPVCNAVHFAHSRNVIHRDIKPENVMVGEYGEVYLLDWGVALDKTRYEPSQSIVGTLAYMAPEMLVGAGEHIGPRTDVYLLGATLHELLTGSPPHARHTDDNDIEDVLLRIHRSEEPVFGKSVPGELAELCRRCLRRDPEQRLPSALAFKAAINNYLEHRGSYELASAATQLLRNLATICRTPDAKNLDAVDVNRMYIECAFGYRQALETWSKNEAARAGLQEATETMLRFELARKNLDGAEAMLEQLLEQRDDLRAAVQSLRDELAAENREVAQLREEAREQDPSEGSGSRAVSALVTGVVLFGIFMALARAYPRAEGLSHRTVAFVTLSLGIALGGGALAAKEKLLATRINRYLSAAIFAIVVGCLLVHVTGDLAGAPTAYGLIADLLVAGTVVATVGINLHVGLVAVGAVYLVGAVVAAAMSAYVLEVMAAVFLLSHLVVAWTWKAVQAAANR
jgi:serine/threonine protein kinase